MRVSTLACTRDPLFGGRDDSYVALTLPQYYRRRQHHTAPTAHAPFPPYSKSRAADYLLSRLYRSTAVSRFALFY